MPRLALALALLTAALGLRFGTFAASGADAYGYVSQAEEREIFRARYSRVADVAWLDRPPLVVAAGRVYFYALPTGDRPGYAGL